jgi:putative sterol carrier protein
VKEEGVRTLEKLLYPSEEWFKAFAEELKRSEAYKEAAKKWEWAIIFVITQIPNSPDWITYSDLWHGEIRSYQFLKSKDEKEAEFVIEGPYATWKSVVKGELESTRAIMSRKFKVTGSTFKMLRYSNAMVEFTKASTRVPSRFVDEETN